ncbi:hypothetical protein GF323_01240 [Candidatus Woesearchaeota archaeon]|nr:hypothetical protein [Candidatus Woesearchaeota archaeon]
MKSKQAQGISINTIIIAAVALIVLVILIAVFTGRMGIWGQQLDDAGEGTGCEPTGTWKVECGAGEEEIFGNFKDSKDNPGMHCCVS